ncbi:MAG: patatin-like phospholipase family protein [Clostridia bacterium]|nr:patatin-like phospholipase family protein [Clostridia bacterium]
MNLKIDRDRSYGIALEGGGAKGAYQIGVWKALKEIGIRYHMISGTSVGALNGSLMTMGDFDLALSVWQNIHISQVINLGGLDEESMLRICTLQLNYSDMRKMAPQMLSILHNRGLDVQPLREWVHQIVDTKLIRSSDIELFACTYSISERKGKEIRINDLPENEICDMLLASAYFPAFRLEKLSGKYYADGWFHESLPLSVLFEHNCRDIIAVALPTLNIQKQAPVPDNVSLTTIRPIANLGGILEFDAERAKTNIDIGYYDAMRVFYGLYGNGYYIDRTMTEKDAFQWLTSRYLSRHPKATLREVCETVLPQKAHKLGVRDGDYYDLFVAVLERLAENHSIEKLAIRTDEQLLSELF